MITFILPTLGRPSLIYPIQSLLKQSDIRWNCIIVLDGCKLPDNCVNIIENNREKFILLPIEKRGAGTNKGAGYVRNAATNYVESEWVAFIDDDDTVSSEYVKNANSIIKENTTIDCILFRAIVPQGIVVPDPKSLDIQRGRTFISYCCKTSIFKEIQFNQVKDEQYEFINLIKNRGYKILLSKYVMYGINLPHMNYSRFISKHFETPVEQILYTYNKDTIIDIYKRTTFNISGKWVALMLESRFNNDIVFVLKQFSRFLSDKWSMILYVTSDVYDKYMKVSSELNNNIQIKLLEYPLTSVKDYNNIMLNIDFWKGLSEFEKVLIFQNDTMMYRYGIEKFMDYDYIGAPWPLEYTISNGVGNGGLSLRTIPAMIYCLENKDKVIIGKYENCDKNLETFDGVHPEDVFYSYAMNQFGFRVAPHSVASKFSIETVMFNEDTIGSHQLSKFNESLYNKLLAKSLVPYNNYLITNVTSHRYGWRYVDSELSKYFNNKDGILLSSYGDYNYFFTPGFSMNGKQWVGISHFTPVDTGVYYKNCDINHLKTNPVFKNDLKTCKGMFVLSEYMKPIVEYIFKECGYSDIPVDVIYHPMISEPPYFNPENIGNIKQIISLGSQLRTNTTIYKLNMPGYKKLWLSGRSKEASISLLNQEIHEFKVYVSDEESKSVELRRLSDEEYDEVILNSYIIIHQMNASANNALLECIVKNIPVFLNRLPAVEEYIGADYPLFFTDIYDLENKLKDVLLIRQAYNYLVNSTKIKELISINKFIKDIANSKITQGLFYQ